MKSFGPVIDRATAFCTYCPKLCRFSCPAAEAESRETVTPWGLMRLLETVRNDSTVVDREVAETFFHCMACKRCETWCKHENDVPQAMFEARAWMHELGQIPEALEGFTSFFEEGKSPHNESRPLSDFPEIGTVEDIFDFRSRAVFMPDCETRHHYPELVLRAGKLLHAVLGYKVRLFTRDGGEGIGCCGFPLLAAGDTKAFQAHRQNLFETLGHVDFLITDCAASVATFGADGSFGQHDAPNLNVKHLIALLAEFVDEIPVKQQVKQDGLMFHDSCFVGRHLSLYEESRTLAAAVVADFEEFQFNRADAPCCGGAAHYHVVAPAASERCATERLEQLEREGGRSIICGSATCKKAFRRVGDAEVATDLLDLVCRACGF